MRLLINVSEILHKFTQRCVLFAEKISVIFQLSELQKFIGVLELIGIREFQQFKKYVGLKTELSVSECQRMYG